MFFRGYSASHFRSVEPFKNSCNFYLWAGAMEFRWQLRPSDWADNKWAVPWTISTEDEHSGGCAPWEENTCCLPEHNKDDGLQEGGTPFSLLEAEVDWAGAEVAWVIPGLQPLVPSWSTGLLERAPLRTDSGQTASETTPIKASLELLVPVQELLFVEKIFLG